LSSPTGSSPESATSPPEIPLSPTPPPPEPGNDDKPPATLHDEKTSDKVPERDSTRE
jgi:hypothetical protein